MHRDASGVICCSQGLKAGDNSFNWARCKNKKKKQYIYLIAALLDQLVGYQTVVREVEGSSPGWTNKII